MLKKSKFFQDLNDEKLLEFADLFKLEMAYKNQTIIIEWNNIENIYILKKWILQTKKADGLKSIILWEIKEWEIFWEMGFFYKQRAIASVICLSDTANFWKISRENFEKFLEKNPEIKQNILTIIYKRQKENREKLWWKIYNNTTIEEEDFDDIEINL